METELKIPVADLAPVRASLVALDARLISESMREENVLLDTVDRELSCRGCVLRLRRHGARRLLTFKGPATFDGPIKTRPEHELEIDDLETMLTVFEALGFSGVMRYEKDRETWRFNDVEVVLDHTPMGNFVEVEGPPGAIGPVALSLGLDPSDAVRGSYVSLWLEFRTRHPELDLPPDMVFGS